MPSKKQKLQKSRQVAKQLTDNPKTPFIVVIMILLPLLVLLSVFIWSPTRSSAFAAAIQQSGVDSAGSIPPLSSNVEKAAVKKVKVETTVTVVASILGEFVHDSNAFTQGLAIHRDALYETTGLYGQSTLRKVDLNTGNVIQKVDFPSTTFAEGLTIFNDLIYVLTWQQRVGYVYDLNFNKVNQWNYNTEGWGIAHNNRNLIMSDGSDTLYFFSPTTFKTIRTLKVKTSTGQSVRFLNELEYINGYVYANVWYQKNIAVINPKTGIVVQWLDCTAFSVNVGDSVLNGIAYNNATGDFYLTGKLWPKIYKIRYEPLSP